MNIQILADKKIPLYDGDIVQPVKVFLEPENRFAVIEVFKGLFVAVRIESLDQELLVGRYIDHIYDSMDDVLGNIVCAGFADKHHMYC